MELENKEDLRLWRRVQVSKCIRVILIFIGIILMQLLAYMICVLGFAGYQLVMGMEIPEAMQKLSDYMSDSGSSLLMWVSAVSASLCMVWCGVLYRKSDWRESPFSYKKAFSIKNLLGLVGVGFGACVVTTVFLSFLVVLFPDAFSSYQELMSHIDYESSLITIPYVLLIGPASEEIIFRGAIMDRFRIAFPFWLANILQAALFGLYHMNLVQGLYAFGLGMALGLIGRVTGTIFASMLTHIIFNTTSWLMGICFDGTGTYEEAVLLVILLVALISLTAGLRYYLRMEKKQRTEAGIE